MQRDIVAAVVAVLLIAAFAMAAVVTTDRLQDDMVSTGLGQVTIDTDGNKIEGNEKTRAASHIDMAKRIIH